MRLKVMVLGHARHGKDTAAEIIAAEYGAKFTSSSLFCAERVMMPAFERMGRPYPSALACFEDRGNGNNRVLWYNAIRAYSQSDLCRLTREIFEENDIYCGCRNWRELQAAKAEGLFDVSIWVDACLRLQPESQDSMTIERWMADYILDNNDDIKMLRQRTKSLMRTIIERLP